MKQICKAFLLVFLGFSGTAQESPTPRVVIPLIANGSHQRPISVTVQSLVIADQKMPVAGATLLRGADLPLELCVLIDSSTSQRYAHLEDLVIAMNKFVGEILRGPEDRVFLLKFEATPQATEWLTKKQWQGTTFRVAIGGATALYDALAMACKQRMGPRDWQKPTRRVLVLIADGDDNQSRITRDEAVSEALKAGTVIFTVNTETSPISTRGEKVTESFATLTGGETFTRLSGGDFLKVFARIGELIDGMYYLTYVPPDASKNAIHEVEVKPAPKEKFKLSYARRYFWDSRSAAPAPP